MKTERVKLTNKPLVEAIFEIRWNLKKTDFGFIDPHYKIVVGRIYDKLSDEYPFHEQLATANMPDGMLEYVIQHRFRKSENNWPLIQVGPGILVVNSTADYVWEDFEKRIIQAVSAFLDIYPDSKNTIKINKILLRYIDSINFDYNNNIFKFLNDKLKIDVSIYKKLFENTDVNNKPRNFDLRFSYNSLKPKGIIDLRFKKGKNKDSDALIWETLIYSNSLEDTDIQKGISNWVKEGHILTDDWFFKLIEGELYERFK